MDFLRHDALAEVPPAWCDFLRRQPKEGPVESTNDQTAPIPEGMRHTTLTSLAGSLRNNGLGTAAIRAALIEVNQERCNPPVPITEIDRIAKDIGAKPIRRKSQAPGRRDETYVQREDGLYLHRQTKDARIAVRLTNFCCTIVATMAHDDGVEVSRRLELETKIGDRTRRIIIPSAEFSNMRWVTEKLGPGAIVYAGNGNVDHSRCAIQVLSGQNLAERVVYGHTGWRKLGDEWAFLHAGGAIDKNGRCAGVEVDLPDALSRLDLPSPSAEELVESVRASVQLTQLGPERTMIPILAATYRAPLGTCDFALHLAGPTGVFKSELAAIAQQHYGSGFDRLHLPGAWSATANSLEGLCFAAKDSVTVVDDFAPTGTAYDRQRFHREADRLFRAQGNSAGRMRMKADLTLRPSRPPRGLILSTGEDIPGGHSLRARILVLELALGEINGPELSAAQTAAAQAKYAKSMAAYLQWLAPQLDEVRKLLKQESAEYRLRAAREGEHARTPGIVADLFIGWKTFLRFAKESAAISEEERSDLETRGWKALCEAAGSQSRHQESQEPARRFIELLSSSIASGDAHVANLRGDPPEPPAAWGWRIVMRGDDANYEPRGRRVGWLHEEDLYLDPDASYRVVQSLAGPGGELPILPQTLRKRLHEAGLLVSTDRARETLTIRRMIESRQRNVLHLNADSVGFKIEKGPLKGPGDAREEF